MSTYPDNFCANDGSFAAKDPRAITSNPLQNGQKDIIMEHVCVTAVGSGILCLFAIAERW